MADHPPDTATLTTDLTRRYGTGQSGLPLAEQCRRRFSAMLALEIRRRRRSMSAARALKDDRLRSLVEGYAAYARRSSAGR
jgi:hypothetical protein